MIVRWLNLFRSKFSLDESLEWELGSTDEGVDVPAEKLSRRETNGRYVTNIGDTFIGLIAKNSAVRKRWKVDVWSYMGRNGRHLRRSKLFPDPTYYSEVWIRKSRASYVGILVRSPLRKVFEFDWEDIELASERFGIPILLLTRDGKIVPIRERRPVFSD